MEYNLGSITYTDQTKRKNRLSFFLMVALLIFTASMAHFIGVFLQDKLIVETAAEQMAEDLQNGSSLRDAAEAFCVSISG